MACQNGINANFIAQSNPIMPVRMHADTMTILLTDYVPAFFGGKADKWVEEMQLIDNGSISAIPYSDRSGRFAIPVLPNKPVRPALVSLGYSDNRLRVGFYDDVENPMLVAYIQNQALDPAAWSENEDGTWTLDLSGIGKWQGRSYLRVFACDEEYLYNDLLLPMQDGRIITDAAELNRHDPQAQVLYSVLIDRFYNGNTTNDWKMNSPEVLDIVDYQGGDLAGITAKIEEGYFDRLGVNTLWISPITQNPWDAWGCYPFKNGNKYDPSKTYTKFSGYHGYWPIFATALDQRFGTPEELHTLLNRAHAHGINVVLDYVANHMHINSPTLQEHPDWHTDARKYAKR